MDYTVIEFPEPSDPRDRAALAAKRQRQFEQEADDLWIDLMAGAITLAIWHGKMRSAIKKYHLEMALIALGGDALLLDERVLTLVELELQRQGQFLDDFANAIEAWYADKGELPKTGPIRARLYGGAGRATFWRSIAPFAGQLPAHPGDGTSECLTNCKCWWDIQMGKERGVWNCYWNMSEVEHCPTCIQRNEEWYPYVLRSTIPPMVFETLQWEVTCL